MGRCWVTSPPPADEATPTTRFQIGLNAEVLEGSAPPPSLANPTTCSWAELV